MLRIANKVTVERLGTDGPPYAVAIEGGSCAEHEHGMAPFARNMGLIPHGYGYAQARGWTTDATFFRKVRTVGIPEAWTEALVIGPFAKHLGPTDGPRLMQAVEDDIEARLAAMEEGIVAAYDEHDVALFARGEKDGETLRWLARTLADAHGVFYPALHSLVIAHREASRPFAFRWSPSVDRRAA